MEPRAVEPIRLDGDRVVILDQTLLPGLERYIELTGLETTCEAIGALRIRGAPLLGVAGAYGMYVAGRELGTADYALGRAADALAGTRPTAVDLGVMVRRAEALAKEIPDVGDARLVALQGFADELLRSRAEEDEQLARYGVELIPEGAAVLTHCNTGALATGGIGTALGVIREAWTGGQLERCYATETRPLLQGARLTAWELKQAGIPATLLPDTAAAALIGSGRVQAVITGADRIAANGDTANKIGTYGLALAAARHSVPFYIAAPTSTVDLDCADGATIPIEHRAASEVGGFGNERWAPEGLDAFNPAFDVTPADLIAAIVTERGVARAPYAEALRRLMGR